MLGILEVKGAATDASVSEREMPTSAAFKAYKKFYTNFRENLQSIINK